MSQGVDSPKLFPHGPQFKSHLFRISSCLMSTDVNGGDFSHTSVSLSLSPG